MRAPLCVASAVPAAAQAPLDGGLAPRQRGVPRTEIPAAHVRSLALLFLLLLPCSAPRCACSRLAPIDDTAAALLHHALLRAVLPQTEALLFSRVHTFMQARVLPPAARP